MKNEKKKTTATTTTTAVAASAATTTIVATTAAAAAATTLLLLTLINGKNAHGLLKSVPEMVKETCSNDIYLSMVVTHSRLLETWQDTAKLGQHEVRQILAEIPEHSLKM